jgi:hypothetical protein
LHTPDTRRSWLITSERADAGKNLQDVPEQASTFGIDRNHAEEPTPILQGRLRSAVFVSYLEGGRYG